jgi:2-alkyl-3-oxoalkanoate reductase
VLQFSQTISGTLEHDFVGMSEGFPGKVIHESCGAGSVASEAPVRKKAVALIGASGFIGLRAAEILSADQRFCLRPIVRAPSSLAVLARQRLDWRICDLIQESSLSEALDGVEVCVHSAIGDAAQIVKMAKVTYRACAAAGVRRLVWLSSASVHGQNPTAGTDETTPLHDRHILMYNNAKVRAEWALERLSQDGHVEVVRLRPSVVYGPRSRWIVDAAAALSSGKACWIAGGSGVCNAIYVDNLVAAIQIAAVNDRAAGQSFYIGDDEPITWREFLLPIAKHFGTDERAFAELTPPVIVPERDSKLAALKMTSSYGKLAPHIPDLVKRLVKGVAQAWNGGMVERNSWHPRAKTKPELSPEMVLLQQANWRFPSKNAREILMYRPQIAFDEGMRRSIMWLNYCQ